MLLFVGGVYDLFDVVGYWLKLFVLLCDLGVGDGVVLLVKLNVDLVVMGNVSVDLFCGWFVYVCGVGELLMCMLL